MPRSRSRRAATASTGSCLQPLEIERAAHPHERGAAARVQAEPPELRGREPAERLAVGGCAKRPTRSLVARTTIRSSSRARSDWISWPQSARNSAPATVGVRSGRSPRVSRIVAPSSGSSREAAQELACGRLRARARTESRRPLLRSSVRTRTAPLFSCHACATSPPISAREHAVAEQSAWRRTRASP